MTGQWFFSGSPVSSTNKTDCHNIAEIFVESDVKHHNLNPKPLPGKRYFLWIYVYKKKKKKKKNKYKK